MPVGASPNADAMLERMRNRYSSCNSYQDSGVLRSAMRRTGEESPSRSAVTFRTAFDRTSGGFYFEFIELPARFFDPTRWVVWRTGASLARTWSTTSASEVEPLDLLSALGAIDGVSSGTSALVPSLLLVEGCAKVKRSFRIADTTTIGGTRSIHLAWSEGENAYDIWLRENDYALLRTSEHRVTGGDPHPVFSESERRLFSPEQLKRLEDSAKKPLIYNAEIDFYPIFDEAISASAFAFSPPEFPRPSGTSP